MFGQTNAPCLRNPVGKGLPVERGELILARAAGKRTGLLTKAGGLEHLREESRLELLGGLHRGGVTTRVRQFRRLRYLWVEFRPDG